MKRKEGSVSRKTPAMEGRESLESKESQESSPESASKVFMVEDGRLMPFSPGEYTMSTLYEISESFDVECRLVKPEDPSSLLYEGKKPSKKTVPVIVNKDGDAHFLDSWSALESEPARLVDAREVLGVTPVKQVFVLKRKEP